LFGIALAVSGSSTPDPAADTPSPSEPSPEWHDRFALLAGAVALGIAVAALWYPAVTAWDIDADDWTGANGNRLLAASLSVPLTVLGGLIAAVGAWMAVVEWRGRFRRADKKDGEEAVAAPDLSKIIEAVGKLRGATLLLVVGGLLMLGSAWIAQSASNPTPPSSSDNSSTTSGQDEQDDNG
jgi:hypothetical protein